MSDNLRKVSFRLRVPEFYPDSTEREQKEMEEDSRWKEGYFHRWVEDLDKSQEIPFIKPVALVESSANGKVYMVEYYNLTFLSKP